MIVVRAGADDHEPDGEKAGGAGIRETGGSSGGGANSERDAAGRIDVHENAGGAGIGGGSHHDAGLGARIRVGFGGDASGDAPVAVERGVTEAAAVADATEVGAASADGVNARAGIDPHAAGSCKAADVGAVGQGIEVDGHAGGAGGGEAGGVSDRDFEVVGPGGCEGGGGILGGVGCVIREGDDSGRRANNFPRIGEIAFTTVVVAEHGEQGGGCICGVGFRAGGYGDNGHGINDGDASGARAGDDTCERGGGFVGVSVTGDADGRGGDGNGVRPGRGGSNVVAVLVDGAPRGRPHEVGRDDVAVGVFGDRGESLSAVQFGGGIGRRDNHTGDLGRVGAGGGNEVEGVIGNIGAEPGLSGDKTAADQRKADGVGADAKCAGGNVIRIELVVAAPGAARDAAAIEIGARRRNGAGPGEALSGVDCDPWARPGEAPCDADSQREVLHLRRGEIERDLLVVVDAHELDHGPLGVGVGADDEVGRGGPTAHANVGGVHDLDLVAVEKSERGAVKRADAEDRV